MTAVAHVTRLRLYPFKSLDGVDVASAAFTSGGGLRFDRAFALLDDAGAFLNAKREPRVHAVRVHYDMAAGRAMFEAGGRRCAFGFDDAPRELEAFFETFLGRAVALRRDDRGGFPDDLRAPGPTLVSVATLATVAEWFPGLGIADVRERLRANIEVDGVPAFWEDQLFGRAGEARPFRIGSSRLGGTNPCARCVVPSRDVRSGEVWPAFAKVVAERRAQALPAWAERSRFDHFYRLTLNTQTLDGRAAINVGDDVAPDALPEAVR